MHYKNWAANAGWKSCVWKDMHKWAGHCRMKGKTICLFFVARKDGGLGCHVGMCSSDSLHAVDLGVAAYLEGSVVFYIIFIAEWGWGGTREERRLRLYALIAVEYSAKGIQSSRYTKLDFSMFGVNDIKTPWQCTPCMGGGSCGEQALSSSFAFNS